MNDVGSEEKANSAL